MFDRFDTTEIAPGLSLTVFPSGDVCLGGAVGEELSVKAADIPAVIDALRKASPGSELP